jgi:hypothetical protein
MPERNFAPELVRWKEKRVWSNFGTHAADSPNKSKHVFYYWMRTRSPVFLSTAGTRARHDWWKLSSGREKSGFREVNCLSKRRWSSPCGCVTDDDQDMWTSTRFNITEFPVIAFDVLTHDDSGHGESPGHRWGRAGYNSYYDWGAIGTRS